MYACFYATYREMHVRVISGFSHNAHPKPTFAPGQRFDRVVGRIALQYAHRTQTQTGTQIELMWRENAATQRAHICAGTKTMHSCLRLSIERRARGERGH